MEAAPFIALAVMVIALLCAIGVFLSKESRQRSRSAALPILAFLAGPMFAVVFCAVARISDPYAWESLGDMLVLGLMAGCFGSLTLWFLGH